MPGKYQPAWSPEAVGDPQPSAIRPQKELCMRKDLNFTAYKQRLEARRAEILRDRDRGQETDNQSPVELDQSRVGRLSRMDAMQQQAMAQATTRRTEIELQRISKALARLLADEYGYCVKCDEEIAAKRLQIDPATLLCIDCARAQEKI